MAHLICQSQLFLLAARGGGKFFHHRHHKIVGGDSRKRHQDTVEGRHPGGEQHHPDQGKQPVRKRIFNIHGHHQILAEGTAGGIDQLLRRHRQQSIKSGPRQQKKEDQRQDAKNQILSHRPVALHIKRLGKNVRLAHQGGTDQYPAEIDGEQRIEEIAFRIDPGEQVRVDLGNPGKKSPAFKKEMHPGSQDHNGHQQHQAPLQRIGENVGVGTAQKYVASDKADDDHQGEHIRQSQQLLHHDRKPSDDQHHKRHGKEVDHGKVQCKPF